MKSIALFAPALPMVFGLGLSVLPADASPATEASASAAASTQPADDVASLIRQLGDDNFRTRLDAADKLRKIGKPALPALAEARQSSNLEIQVRSKDLIQDIEHPVSPPERVPQASGANGSHSIAITRDNRTMVVIAKDPGRTTRVEEGAGGIHMTVTGQLDGQEVIRQFNAKDAEALKKANPEAFALYQESTGLLHGIGGSGLPGGMVIQHRHIGGVGGAHIEIHGAAGIAGGGNIVLEKPKPEPVAPIPPAPPATQP